MLKLEELEDWIYKGFSGLYRLALQRATTYREIKIAPETIAYLKSVRDQFEAVATQLEKRPTGEISQEEWDYQHVLCYAALLRVLQLRLEFGPRVRGSGITQNIRNEIDRMDVIISGYGKLNERLIP